MKVFKEIVIHTEDQSVYKEDEDIILYIKEKMDDLSFKTYLNKQEALELSKILINYAEEL